MKTTEVFQVKEPKILKEEILILKDKYFHAGSVAIATAEKTESTLGEI